MFCIHVVEETSSIHVGTTTDLATTTTTVASAITITTTTTTSPGTTAMMTTEEVTELESRPVVFEGKGQFCGKYYFFNPYLFGAENFGNRFDRV